VVERGVGRERYVEDMQRVVARQAHRIGRLEELIESYERLSRKTCKVLQGLGSTEGGIAREETLVTLAGDLPTKKSIDGMHRNVRQRPRGQYRHHRQRTFLDELRDEVSWDAERHRT
jgi:hypothetical protein